MIRPSLQRLVLHIGAPKTGTSIIQSHLAQNREALRNRGILYPVTISSDPVLYRTFESHHLLMYSLADWEPFNRYSPNHFLELARETAERHALNTLLLSAENAYWLPRQIVGNEIPPAKQYWAEKRAYIERVRRLFDGFSERIVVIYLRRQDRWLESWYNQQVKNGNSLPTDMEEFIEQSRYLLDYAKLLELWADAFGMKNIIVRPYEKAQLGRGLFEEFCASTGIERPEELQLRKAARYNAQLDRDTLEFLNICNGLPMTEDQRRWLRLTVRRVTNQMSRCLVFHEQSLLSPQQRLRLLDEYRDMNAAIAKYYLGRADGRLFLEEVQSDSGQWQPYGGLDAVTVTRLLMQVLLSMQKEMSSGVGSPQIDSEISPMERALADRKLWNETLWKYEA